MPHKYNNFDDAYADFVDEYDNILNYITWTRLHVTNAYEAAQQENWLSAITWLCSAINTFVNGFERWFDLFWEDYEQSHFIETIYWANKDVEAGEVTMDAILNAMLTADFDQYQQFIGIEDAYRMALWNKEFNTEFYAALGRGFAE